jgi:hypothetical protein
MTYIVGYVQGWADCLTPLIKGVFTTFEMAIECASIAQFYENKFDTSTVFIAEIVLNREYYPLSVLPIYEAFDSYYIVKACPNGYGLFNKNGIKICNVSKKDDKSAPETILDIKNDNVPETAPKTKIETVPETVPETKIETVPETIPKTKIETVPETVLETKIETVPETVPETKIETVPETKIETVPETAPETKKVMKAQWRKIDQNVSFEDWQKLRKKK